MFKGVSKIPTLKTAILCVMETRSQPVRRQPIITVETLSKSVGHGRTGKEILRNVSFSVADGSFTIITGQSGSGKSSLLRVIGGLSHPTKGSVKILDKDLYTTGDRARSRYRNQTLGFVFQDYRLIPHYTALQNVMVPLKIAGLSGRKQRQRALELLKAVGLASFAHQRVTELSGGQQQRVGIARALVTQPKILIADEPTGNLDSKTGDDIITLLKSVQAARGTTILMVTHNESLARLADQRIRLKDGMIERTA